MSGSDPNSNNRAPSGNYPPSDNNTSPRHGRIRSRTIDSPDSPQGTQRAYPAGSTPPSQDHRPSPTVIYSPNQQPNDLQSFVGLSMEPFLRWAFAVVDDRGCVRPNHNYLPDIDNAVYWIETIDAFDRDPRLMHELILRIPNSDLGHPAMEPIRQNRSMVELLLYRHYQRHGGLVLQPTAPASEAMQRYDQTVQQARAECARRNGVQLIPENAEWPRLRFPSWKDTKGSEADKENGKDKSSGGMERKPF